MVFKGFCFQNSSIGSSNILRQDFLIFQIRIARNSGLLSVCWGDGECWFGFRHRETLGEQVSVNPERDRAHAYCDEKYKKIARYELESNGDLRTVEVVCFML